VEHWYRHPSSIENVFRTPNWEQRCVTYPPATPRSTPRRRWQRCSQRASPAGYTSSPRPSSPAVSCSAMTFAAAKHDRYSAAPADPRPGSTDPTHPPPSNCAYPPHDPAQRGPQPHSRLAHHTLTSVDRPRPPEPAHPRRHSAQQAAREPGSNPERSKAEETSTIRYPQNWV
jgi:hypothetical protein